MARNPVQVRDALPDDAATLVSMWQASVEATVRLAAPSVPAAAGTIADLALDPDQRLVVAVLDDGQVVGVAHLVRSALSPLHAETTVRVGHLFVDEHHRRRGVGRALLAAAAAWADEKQIDYLTLKVSAAAREANRFFARLGLGSIATVRAAPVAALQERLARYDAADAAERHVVVERMRTLRRRQATARRRQLQP